MAFGAAADQRLSIAESLRRLENDEPLAEVSLHAETGNGHHAAATLPDEMIDLPTPFPPTRALKPPSNRLD